MAGETLKSEALCLDIRPWSRTSHVVSWLTPAGIVKTVVKGAVRPKSAFLGQYDFNYTCQIVYYLRERGNLHALRECAPLKMREALRGNYRALALAGYMRLLAGELVIGGVDCEQWFELLDSALDGLGGGSLPHELLASMLHFDLEVMRLGGIAPDFSGYDKTSQWSEFSLSSGMFVESGQGRRIRIQLETSRWLSNPGRCDDVQILLDAARVIGVFYQFHLDYAVEARRDVLKLILHNDNEKAVKI